MPPADCLDAVALALAVAAMPARAARVLRAEPGLWPHLPLGACLARLELDAPGAERTWRDEAARTLSRASSRGYVAVWPAHEAYPMALSEIVDPPLLLWCEGRLDALAAPMVAVVGSRHASAAGRDVAFQLAADLAAAGVVVVSGFARGIDAAAHRGALTRGRTLAVLGCGLDCRYPREHEALGTAIVTAGLRLSEFAPGLGPRPHHFPLRNRAISGLCAGIVVVQATERSGSLITARLALEQGREVMAVPGDVRTGTHAGAHALIRDGARLVERAADVLDQLGWRVTPSRPADEAVSDGPAGRGSGLPALLRREDGMTLDDLLGETGRSAADLLGELLDLELAGRVRRDVGGRFLPSERKW